MFRFIVLLTSLQRTNQRMNGSKKKKYCSNKQINNLLYLIVNCEICVQISNCTNLFSDRKMRKGEIEKRNTLADAIEMILKRKTHWTVFFCLNENLFICQKMYHFPPFDGSFARFFQYSEKLCEIDFYIIPKKSLLGKLLCVFSWEHYYYNAIKVLVTLIL